MKKILLCLDKNQFVPFDYSLNWKEALRAQGFNTGNNVFQFSLQKLLTNDQIELTIDTDFLNNTENFVKKTDFINENYDFVITCPANVIAIWAKNTALIRWTNAISKIKIPFIFVGVGAQSDIAYNLDFLQNIRYEAYEFIKAILNTGSIIGLRGEFTAECFEKLGFRREEDYEVIGCPSLFMNGGNIKIEKDETLSRNTFRPAFNGFKIWFDNDFCMNFEKYNKSIYVCQDEFIRIIYHPSKCIKKDKNYLSNKYIDLLSNENRLKLYSDFLGWIMDLKERKINFSFGTRIHGNIVPLLAGIPAFVDVIDSRTRELTEFFSIPHRQMSSKIKNDPFDLYIESNFDEFNKKFNSLYKNFVNYFSKQGVHIEDDNLIQKNIINELVKIIHTPCSKKIDSQKLLKRI